MVLTHSSKQRRGASAVEAALVFPLVFLITLGMIVGGFGIFRNHEMAWLARDAARFASTHAGEYATDNKVQILAGTLPDVDKQYIIDNIIKGQAAGLDTSVLDVSITIKTANGEYDWDNTADTYDRNPTSLSTSDSKAYQNVVKVTVTYEYAPAWFFGSMKLTSISEMPISY